MKKKNKAVVTSPVTRHVGRIRFDDLSGYDFERLVFAFAVRGGWPKAEWLGQSGGDSGQDIWCGKGERPATVFVCANYKRLTFEKVASDLAKLVSSVTHPVDIVVVSGGSIGASLRAKTKTEAARLGFSTPLIWSGPEFEEKIRMVAGDLLKRFFEGEVFPVTAHDLRKAFAGHSRPSGDVRAVLAGSAVRDASKLSPEAAKLLAAMAGESDGRLLRTESHDGYGLVVGDVEFLPDTAIGKTKALWERAIRELRERGLIDYDGPSREIFAVTADGYTFFELDLGFRKEDMPDPAQYFRDINDLIPEDPFEEGSVKVDIPARPYACLRIYPVVAASQIGSSAAAKYLAVGGHLRPMGIKVNGSSPTRNVKGALVYSGPFGGKLTNFTQLFLNGEICGIDMQVVHRVHQNKESGAVVVNLLMVYEFELSCVLALENFITFARGSLGQRGDLNLEVSLHGVMDTSVGFGFRNAGRSLGEKIGMPLAISAGKVIPLDVLAPFFSHVWEAYGLLRPVEAHKRLVDSLGT